MRRRTGSTIGRGRMKAQRQNKPGQGSERNRAGHKEQRRSAGRSTQTERQAQDQPAKGTVFSRAEMYAMFALSATRMRRAPKTRKALFLENARARDGFVPRRLVDGEGRATCAQKATCRSGAWPSASRFLTQANLIMGGGPHMRTSALEEGGGSRAEIISAVMKPLE